MVAVAYALLALANILFYWPKSPFYFLGFRDPLIWLWLYAALTFTAVFFLLVIWLFNAGNARWPNLWLIIIAVVFALINGVPAFFLYNFYPKVYTLFHLFPAALLLPLFLGLGRRRT